jgi:hypothetical protein
MMTRRLSLIALAGLVSGFLVTGSFSLPRPVSAAQHTQTEIKQKGKETAKKGQAKWESLSPEQQQQLQDKWHVTADQAQEKWDSMSPEQQQQAKAKGKTAAQKTRQKWQTLPQ